MGVDDKAGRWTFQRKASDPPYSPKGQRVAAKGRARKQIRRGARISCGVANC